MLPSVGAIVKPAENPREIAVADPESCARPLIDVPPVPCALARASVNTTSLPATAAVTPIFIRTPTRNARFVDWTRNSRTGDWAVVAMAIIAESNV